MDNLFDFLAQAALELMLAKKRKNAFFMETGVDIETLVLLAAEEAGTHDPKEYTPREALILAAHAHWVNYMLARAWIVPKDLYVENNRGNAQHTREHGIWFRFELPEESLAFQFSLASVDDLWNSKMWGACQWKWSWLGLYISDPTEDEREDRSVYTCPLEECSGLMGELLADAQAFFM